MFNRTNKKIVNYAYSFNKFNKVSVDIPTGDIIFKTSSKYSVSYSGLEKIAPDVKVKNGNLKISFSKVGKMNWILLWVARVLFEEYFLN